MKNTLIFIGLFAISIASIGQSFNYDWHKASNERRFYSMDIEVLNDTIYTLYRVLVTDSIDVNFSKIAEDWVYTNTPGVSTVILITKHSSNGNYIESFKVIEDPNNYIDVERFIVDQSGKMILIGDGRNTTVDFNPNGTSVNSYTATSPNDQFSFVSFYNLNGLYGGHFEYGGSSVHFTYAVTNNNGDLFLSGILSDTADFDFTAGTDIHISNGNRDGFVMKMNVVNQTYNWTKIIGGVGSDYINYLDYKNGKLLINGQFRSDSIDLNPNVGVNIFHHSSHTDENEFTTIWNSNGVFENGLVLASQLNETESGGVSFDDEGNIYMIGEFEVPDSVNVNPNGTATYLDTLLVNMYDDVFYIIKYDSNLVLVWHQTIGDSGQGLELEAREDKSAIKDAGNYMLVNLSGLNGSLIQSINGGIKDTLISVSGNSGLLIALNKNSGSFDYIDIYEGVGNTNRVTFHETFALPNGDFYGVGYYYRSMDFNNYDSLTLLDSAYGGWNNSPFILKLNSNGFVGLSDVKTVAATIKVYPNPTNSKINIESKAILKGILIFDIKGKVLLNRTARTKKISNIDVYGLSTGIYFIKVIDINGIVSVQKVIKN